VLLGVTPGRRGILYHRLFSSEEAGFVSEPAEVQLALSTVSQAIKPLRKGKHIPWILDSGTGGLPAALDLLEQCASASWQRKAGDQTGLVGAGPDTGHELGAVAAADRLAGGG
jgi:hypothetical protein